MTSRNNLAWGEISRYWIICWSFRSRGRDFMVEAQELMPQFARAGFKATHETRYVLELESRSARTLYLDKQSSVLRLVIEEGASDQLLRTFGQRLGNLKTYFNSNMRKFPRRQNKGKKPEHCGTSIKPDNSATLTEFLHWFSDR